MTYRALANTIVTGFMGYGYGWRFSDARSVPATTSDRVHLGGHTTIRCHTIAEN